MIRQLSITFFLLFFFASFTAVAQVKVGYLNIQQVLSEHPEREQIEQELTTLVQTKQQELEQRAGEFQSAVAQYQENQASLSEQQRQTREQELGEMEDSLSEFQQSIQVEIQQRRAELLQPIYNEIDEAIAAIAEEMGLDFVLNKTTSTGDNIIYFAAQPELDITEKVVERLSN
jgi:outer membrane protein